MTPVLSALAGGRLLGARFGTAPAAVLALHGWRRSHADFDGVLAGLDAVAPDLPGFGATGAPPAAWGAADYAAAIAPVLDEAAAGMVVIGHSFGGRIATLLAATRPEAVRALVLTGVPLTRPPGWAPPQAPLAFRVARRLNRWHLLSDERIERRRRSTGSDDYRAASGVMRDVLVRAIHETDDGTYLRALAQVRCPVEFVWGERDSAAPSGVVDLAAAACRSEVRVTTLTGVGHLTPIEAPAALRDALDRAGRGVRG